MDHEESPAPEPVSGQQSDNVLIDRVVEESPSHSRKDSERVRDQVEVLIEALAAGASDEQAARLAGCSDRTVRRRRHDDPDFARAVSRRRSERVAALTGRLVEMGHPALDVLLDALSDDAPRVRLKAAELILSLGNRLRRVEVDDQIQEVVDLADGVADERAAVAATESGAGR